MESGLSLTVAVIAFCPSILRVACSGSAVVVHSRSELHVEVADAELVVGEVGYGHVAVAVKPVVGVSHFEIGVDGSRQRRGEHRHAEEILNPEVVDGHGQLVVATASFDGQELDAALVALRQEIGVDLIVLQIDVDMVVEIECPRQVGHGGLARGEMDVDKGIRQGYGHTEAIA